MKRFCSSLILFFVAIVMALPSVAQNQIVNSYRERTPIGFKEVKVYAHGGRIEAYYKPCGMCGGTGRCGICMGQGGIVSAGYGTYIPCASCGQTGRCRLCVQTGGYVLYDSHLYDANGRRIYVSSGSSSYDSGSSSSRSSRSNSHNSGTCSSCGGTGVSPTPNTGGSRSSWVAHYNSSGQDCPYCNRYDSHFHDRCASCNVPRY